MRLRSNAAAAVRNLLSMDAAASDDGANAPCQDNASHPCAQEAWHRFRLHTYVYDSGAESIVCQAAEALGVEPARC